MRKKKKQNRRTAEKLKKSPDRPVQDWCEDWNRTCAWLRKHVVWVKPDEKRPDEIAGLKVEKKR